MTAPDPQTNETAPSDFVWSFRGYKLHSGEFTTAMVHLFRAEVQRANVWRQRLDTTTNWAVLTTGTAVSFAFAEPRNHIVILLNLFLVTIFLMIEARRYRYYELWSYRVRLMESDFFASMLVPPFHPSADWAEALAESLLHPVFPISTLEAVGRRLRRNYLYIYAVIIIAWIAKLWLLPVPTGLLDTVFERASLGPVGGKTVIGLMILFAAIMVLISLGTIGLHEGAGEILPRFGAGSVETNGQKKADRMAWFRPAHRRPQLLTLIITDQAQAVADRVLKDMGRGVTGMEGRGMFTGQQHMVLICALTVTEVPQLKAIVAEADPRAFVVVSPAQEILGKGFVPLQEEE
jgi:uncharacterized membrane protein